MNKTFYCTFKRKYVSRCDRHACIVHYYSILARFLAMASSTAFSSRRSSSLLEEVFAVFGFPDVNTSAWESADLLSGLFADCAVTDDETASLAWLEASRTGDGSRGRFLAASCFSLLLLASVLSSGECWEGGLEGSPLSGRSTDCNDNIEQNFNELDENLGERVLAFSGF